MKKFAIIITFLLICSNYLKAELDSSFKIVADLSVGASYSYFDKAKYYDAKSHSSLGGGASIRLMWHPDGMLLMGIMSGFYHLSYDQLETADSTSASASLSAIPLQLAFSMKYKVFEIGLGIGPYLLKSEINYHKVAIGYRPELALTFFSSYKFKISDKISIAPEIRTLYLRYRSVFSAIPSVNFSYEIIRYNK